MAYDIKVAARRLGDVVGSGESFAAQRVQAGTGLLNEFERLTAHYGLGPSRDGGDLKVNVLGQTVKVSIDQKSGQVQVGRWFDGVYKLEEVPLVYVPSLYRFEGKEHDHEIAPTPGELIPRKNGLAVLVEAVLKLAERTT